VTQVAARWAGQGHHDVLVDRLLGSRFRHRAWDFALILAGAVLLGLAAQVRIPLGFTPVPLTGQTFAVLLVGAAWGPLRGAAAVLLYLAVGLAGAPVFTDAGSGVGHILGPTGGYLIGFVLAAAVAGGMARHRLDRSIGAALVSMLLASAVIYACGVMGLMAVTGASLTRAIELGVAPFLMADAVKAIAAAIVLPAAWRIASPADEAER
jgi:biotin transport system substrate-specific component